MGTSYTQVSSPAYLSTPYTCVYYSAVSVLVAEQLSYYIPCNTGPGGTTGGRNGDGHDGDGSMIRRLFRDGKGTPRRLRHSSRLLDRLVFTTGRRLGSGPASSTKAAAEAGADAVARSQAHAQWRQRLREMPETGGEGVPFYKDATVVQRMAQHLENEERVKAEEAKEDAAALGVLPAALQEEEDTRQARSLACGVLYFTAYSTGYQSAGTPNICYYQSSYQVYSSSASNYYYSTCSSCTPSSAPASCGSCTGSCGACGTMTYTYGVCPAQCPLVVSPASPRLTCSPCVLPTPTHPLAVIAVDTQNPPRTLTMGCAAGYVGTPTTQTCSTTTGAWEGALPTCIVASTSPTPSVTPSNTVSASPTRSTTPSRSVTPSFSVTPSQTPSVSVTPSVTPSTTPSTSITPSGTPSNSVSVSTTKSPSVTPSGTPSTSVSASITKSPSVTPSRTPSISMSASNSKTPSVTPTGTLSNSVSASMTRSPSGTPSRSASASRTPSGTPSSTRSASLTPSGTVTPSFSPSNSRSPSRTPSSSRTPSGTPSGTVTPTGTPSGTATPTGTPSGTATPTGSASTTATLSASASVTATLSASASVTATLSASASVTVTSSASASVTVTSSASASTTSTPSRSASTTATRSVTPSGSTTASVTPSLSVSPSLTPTVSATQSTTSSFTPSVSLTPTSTASVTASASSSATATVSASQTATSSAHPSRRLIATGAGPTQLPFDVLPGPGTPGTWARQYVPGAANSTAASVAATGTGASAATGGGSQPLIELPPPAAPGVFIECEPPAELRCLGFNRTTGAPVCGLGYAAAPACMGCLDGFYTDATGACQGCPVSSGSPSERLWTALRPLLLGVAVVAGLALFMLALVLLVLRKFGGTFRGGLQRTLQFSVTAVLVIQTIAQVASTLKGIPELPPLLHAVVAVVSAFQMESEALPHPRCTALPPFLWTYLLYSVMAAALLTLLVAFACCGDTDAGACNWRCIRSLKRRLSRASSRLTAVSLARRRQSSGSREGDERPCSSKHKPGAGVCTALKHCSGLLLLSWLRRHGRTALLLLVSVLYSVVASSAFAALRCKSIYATVASYSALDQDGATLLAPINADLGCTGTRGAVVCPEAVSRGSLLTVPLFSVQVLASDPGYVCWESSHRVLGIASIIALVVGILGFPAVTCVWVRRRLRARRAASAAASALGLLRVPDAAKRSSAASRAASTKGSSGVVSSAKTPPARADEPSFTSAPGDSIASRRLSWSRVGRGNAAAASPSSETPDKGCCGVSPRGHPLRLDADPFVLGDSRLGFFMRGTYLPSRWWWRHVEFVTTAALAAAAAYFAAGSMGSLASVTAILLASSVGLLVVRPYTSLVQWNYPVRLLATVVASLTLACAYVAAPSRDGQTPAPASLTPLSYACFAASLLLILALVMGFVTVVLRGAVVERLLLEAAKRRRWQSGPGALGASVNALDAFIQSELARVGSLRLVFKSPFSLTPLAADAASPVAPLLAQGSHRLSIAPAPQLVTSRAAYDPTPVGDEKASTGAEGMPTARPAVSSIQYVTNTLLSAKQQPPHPAESKGIVAGVALTGAAPGSAPAPDKQQPVLPLHRTLLTAQLPAGAPAPRPLSFSLHSNPLGVRRVAGQPVPAATGAATPGFVRQKRKASKATFSPTLARESDEVAVPEPQPAYRLSLFSRSAAPHAATTQATTMYMNRLAQQLRTQPASK